MPSTFRDLRQFATETADPNFSLSVPEPAKQVIRELLAIIDAAIAVHVPMSYWSGDSHDAMYDEDGEQVEPEGQVCLTCSGPSVEDDISNWELDLGSSDVVEWPCETVLALGGSASSDAGRGDS